jgi:hypothetical protein
MAKVTPEKTNINGIRYIMIFCCLANGLSRALAGVRRPFLRPGAGKVSYPPGRPVAGPGDTVGPSLTRAYPLGVGSTLSPTLATCPRTP